MGASRRRPPGAARPIALTGQGHWCAELAEGLRRYADLDVDVASFDRLSDAFDPRVWTALLRARVIVVVGFRPGAPTLRGRLFDAAFALVERIGRPKRVVRYWIGTDVDGTVRDRRAGRLSARFGRAVARAEHFAGSAPLAERLAEIGVRASVVDFPWLGMPAFDEPPPMPRTFSVLSYVPDARYDLYGGPQLIEAARALPGVPFDIVGGTGGWAQAAPGNVRFLGWRDDMGPLYEAAACVVRLVEHDSIGATAVEALAYGRSVVYSIPLEHTVLVPFDDVARLVEVLRNLSETYRGPAEVPDRQAAEWAREHFAPSRLFGGLATRLLEVTASDEPHIAAGSGPGLGGSR